jgi:hypothetical protein
VDGVILAGMLFDAGPASSPVLLEVGPAGSKARHAKDPASLHDVFFRVGGGAGVRRASVSLQINSNDVIVDHTWIWRADHGSGVGWNSNTAANGCGTASAAESTFTSRKSRTIRPTSSYTSAPGVNGWASYKVAAHVTTHEAWGLGIYSVFRQKGVTLSRAIETPPKPGVKFHSMITCRLGNNGEITNIVRPKLTSYPE